MKTTPYVGTSSDIIRKLLEIATPIMKISSRELKIKPLYSETLVLFIRFPALTVETSQLLKKRLSQHKNDVKKHSDNTALAEHTLDSGHMFDFENCTIVGRENNNKKRKY